MRRILVGTATGLALLLSPPCPSCPARGKMGGAASAPAGRPGVLAEIIGKRWTRARAELERDGYRVVNRRDAAEGHAEYIFARGASLDGCFRLMVSRARVDQVEAWSPPCLRPRFRSVAGEIGPDVPVTEIEKRHGEPLYLEYGQHGLRMKGWRIGEYLVFVESSNGMRLTPDVGRVYAFRRGMLPPTERMWSLKGRTTLADLARGRRYVESDLWRREPGGNRG